MTLRTQTTLLLSLPFSVALILSGCGDDGPSTGSGDGDSGSETATDSGESGTQTGDGDPSTGDGDPECPVGSEGCPCTGGGVCDSGLVCEAGLCVPAATTGDGDPTGDGDGDPGNACQGDEFIEILAVDASDILGWNPVMSQLGEGMILAYDQQNPNPNAYVSWDLDIPCDDDWHVWIRGLDYQQQDSYFVLVDGGPMPVPVFEIDCTGDPQQQAIYSWKELNWRDQMDPGCQYVEDPWVQTWMAGPHNVTLGYRPQESYAVSRIWVTNTNMMPPMP